MAATRIELRGAGGLRLCADAWGDPSGPPVLLLHGGGQTRHAWGTTAEALASAGLRPVAVDARGHGDSAWSPDGEYTLDVFVDDLLALAEAFDRVPAVVGASLGGSTGLLAAGGRGLDVPALVLVDIAPHIEPEGVRRIHAFMSAHPDGFASLDQAADAVAAYLPHRRRPRSTRGLEKNLRLVDGRYRWHWDPMFLERMFVERPAGRADELADAARALSMPTLLVRGKLSDLLSEEGARRFLELAPHARFVDVRGAAHMVAGDDNDRFSLAVVSFLTEVLAP